MRCHLRPLEHSCRSCRSEQDRGSRRVPRDDRTTPGPAPRGSALPQLGPLLVTRGSPPGLAADRLPTAYVFGGSRSWTCEYRTPAANIYSVADDLLRAGFDETQFMQSHLIDEARHRSPS